MNKPTISVVMSVYNSDATLTETIQYILSQSFSDFEFIIIDGSSDNSVEIIKDLQKKDSRIKLVRQENQGLTKALIRGCGLAQGEFIARQDAGDISFKERFKEQLKVYSETPNLVMVSSGTHFVTPNRELLYTVVQSDADASNGLIQTDVENFRGPSHHGSVLFRRDIYQRVGGYRAPFTVAQDIDLWTRMVEHGEHKSTDKVYYQASLAKNAISATKREQQVRMTEMVIKCAKARNESGSDQAVVATIEPSQLGPSLNASKLDSAYYYFLASNLTHSNPSASVNYLKRALRADPLHFKAMIKLMSLSLKYRFTRR